MEHKAPRRLCDLLERLGAQEEREDDHRIDREDQPCQMPACQVAAEFPLRLPLFDHPVNGGEKPSAGGGLVEQGARIGEGIQVNLSRLELIRARVFEPSVEKAPDAGEGGRQSRALLNDLSQGVDEELAVVVKHSVEYTGV